GRKPGPADERGPTPGPGRGAEARCRAGRPRAGPHGRGVPGRPRISHGFLAGPVGRPGVHRPTGRNGPAIRTGPPTLHGRARAGRGFRGARGCGSASTPAGPPEVSGRRAAGGRAARSARRGGSRTPKPRTWRRAPPPFGRRGRRRGPREGSGGVGDALARFVLGDGEGVHHLAVGGAGDVVEGPAVHRDRLVGLGVGALRADLGAVVGPVGLVGVVHLGAGDRDRVDRADLHRRVLGAVAGQVAPGVGVVVALQHQVHV